MTNTTKLLEKINASGLKRSFIAQKLELSVYGFARKVNNQSEFTASEIAKLCEVLGITDNNELREIFFAQ